MKSHHHQTPVRKSPRLSSSSIQLPKSTAKRSKTPSESNENDAWALSLYVEHDQSPLNTISHPPDGQEVKSLRRSARFTTNKFKSPPIEVKKRTKKFNGAALLLTSQLRRSPRFSSSSSAPPLTLGSSKRRRSQDKGAVSPVVKKGKLGIIIVPEKNGDNLRSRKINRALGDETPEKKLVESAVTVKCLRSSTVKTLLGNEEKRGSKKHAFSSPATTDYPLIEWHEPPEKWNAGSGLRRSPRLLNEDPELELVALPQKSALSVEKCSMSKNVKSNKEMVLISGSRVMSNEKCLMPLEVEHTLDSSPRVLEKRDLEEKIRFNADVDANDTVNSEKEEKKTICCFVGDPIPEEVAQERWKWRYELKSKRKGKGWKINADEEDEIILDVDCHYAQAKVANFVLDIGDCVYVKGEEGKKNHVGRILEFFKTMEGHDYFRVQWFYRAEDTVMKDVTSLHDKRRLFYSTVMNDNILDCIVSKVNVVKVPPSLCLKSNPIQSAAFYYDMEYCVEYSTFRTLVTETSTVSKPFLLNSNQLDEEPITFTPLKLFPTCEPLKPELSLLDLYSGCGGMSTGLCIGAKLSNVNLVTKWAVDYNSAACDSLKLNHPETHVRNEAAENFLELLRQWERLCKLYVYDLERTLKCELESDEGLNIQLDNEVSSGEYEVFCLLDICYGDPGKRGKCGLHFKVRWKGYGPDDDTWEPIEGLSNCEERIQEFVRNGLKRKILPLPGDVDVICGGPPCQGISGYNRYRNFDSPLTDERNRQIIIFMDIVEFLKPKYVLMENVVDIIRFDKASLGRYALSRLVNMRYQARLGTMASGCYGLPQFRLRVFIWGAHSSQTLPQFPLPTHNVVVRYWPPLEFERNIVAYDEGQPRTLEQAIILRDSISDLPEVTNDDSHEEMAYDKLPETEFQTYIRLSKDEMMGPSSSPHGKKPVLYDHRPLQLSEDDYARVCLIPRRKGANFRDFPGVVVGEDNVARRDPSKEPIMLPSGKLLVPECALNFEHGKSKKPYSRLWWDETVSTIVTFPYLRCQTVLHPEQDRILTIRECARLQGFPDFYRFSGTVKERYCQIGNAVSVPVGRALGYALGMAYQKLIGDGPLMVLPPKFSSKVSLNDEMTS